MRKKRAGLVLLACACVGCLLYSCYQGEQARRYALRMFCWNVANDLVTKTNSTGIVLLHPYARAQLERLLGTPTRIEAIRLGDKLSDVLSLEEKATARLCFINDINQHLEIRTRQTRDLTNFTVIGTLWY